MDPPAPAPAPAPAQYMLKHWYPFLLSDRRIMWFLDRVAKGLELPGLNGLFRENPFAMEPEEIAGGYIINDDIPEVYFLGTSSMRSTKDWKRYSAVKHIHDGNSVIGQKQRFRHKRDLDWFVDHYKFGTKVNGADPAVFKFFRCGIPAVPPPPKPANQLPPVPLDPINQPPLQPLGPLNHLPICASEAQSSGQIIGFTSSALPAQSPTGDQPSGQIPGSTSSAFRDWPPTSGAFTWSPSSALHDLLATGASDPSLALHDWPATGASDSQPSGQNNLSPSSPLDG